VGKVWIWVKVRQRPGSPLAVSVRTVAAWNSWNCQAFYTLFGRFKGSTLRESTPDEVADEPMATTLGKCVPVSLSGNRMNYLRTARRRQAPAGSGWDRSTHRRLFAVGPDLERKIAELGEPSFTVKRA
jgi:hypothetical protein